MILFHGTNYHSAINIFRSGIDLSYSKPFLDFGPGFYTTPDYQHAVRTAFNRTATYNAKYKKNESPYVIKMNFNLNKDLCFADYSICDERWGNFVVNNRLSEETIEKYHIIEHNKDKKYDICYGVIADGQITNIAYKINHGMILPGDICFKDFLKSDGTSYPMQYSFHTLKSVSCLDMISCNTARESRHKHDIKRR